MTQKEIIEKAFYDGAGILHLVPNFAPKSFGAPGHRLKLDPRDYYAFGTQRGAIKERRMSSAVAVKHPLAAKDEGLSYFTPIDDDCRRILFKDALEQLKDRLIGSELYNRYGTWPMFAKFFDYQTPLFHHVHITDSKAELVGKTGKPECYYYPPQLNPHMGDLPVTFFGFDPSTTKEQVRECLDCYEAEDNKIKELSRGYKIELGTGWYTPPGVLHSPGSLLTYEPQWNSDVNAVFENITNGFVNTVNLLNKDCPEDKKMDKDFIMTLLDWEKNVDPFYKQHYFRPPVMCRENEIYSEKWIAYGNEYIGAKELSIKPGSSGIIYDNTAFGCVIIQGHGCFGKYDCEAAIMLRYGQHSGDEFFVSESAAMEGIEIKNNSKYEPMVILKHFANNNKEMP